MFSILENLQTSLSSFGSGPGTETGSILCHPHRSPKYGRSLIPTVMSLSQSLASVVKFVFDIILPLWFDTVKSLGS
jgi:hypothetical protein